MKLLLDKATTCLYLDDQEQHKLYKLEFNDSENPLKISEIPNSERSRIYQNYEILDMFEGIIGILPLLHDDYLIIFRSSKRTGSLILPNDNKNEELEEIEFHSIEKIELLGLKSLIRDYNKKIQSVDEKDEKKFLKIMKNFFSHNSKYFHYSTSSNTTKTKSYLIEKSLQSNLTSSFTTSTSSWSDTEFLWNLELAHSFSKTSPTSLFLLHPIITPVIFGKITTSDLTFPASFLTSPTSSDATNFISSVEPTATSESENDFENEEKSEKNEKNITLKITLISRISKERAGPRFFARGANELGFCGNFVETEQIVQCFSNNQGVNYKPNPVWIKSFVILRGSIPLDWSQPPDMSNGPKIKVSKNQIVVDSSEKNQIAVDSSEKESEISDKGVKTRLGMHFERITSKYGPVSVISLIHQYGNEGVLAKEYREQYKIWYSDSLEKNFYDYSKIITKKIEDPKKTIPLFFEFDLLEEAGAFSWNKVDEFVDDKLLPWVNSFGFFEGSFNYSEKSKKTDFEIKKKQNGVFRVNCQDCLDRTNAMQQLIAKRSMKIQIVEAFSNTKIETIKTLVSKVEKNLQKNWVTTGDSVSHIYAGSRACSREFTLKGKRTIFGYFEDGVSVAQRFIQNNFYDGEKQDAIDLFLRKYKINRKNYVSPFSKKNKKIKPDQNVPIPPKNNAKNKSKNIWLFLILIVGFSVVAKILGEKFVWKMLNGKSRLWAAEIVCVLVVLMGIMVLGYQYRIKSDGVWVERVINKPRLKLNE